MVPFSGDPTRQAFVQQLNKLGYFAGKNIAIEYRFPEGKDHQLEPNRRANWCGAMSIF
jgi:hypothetical protein